MNSRKSRSTKSKQLALMTAIVVIAALYFGRAILIPFAIAGLLSFLLAPLVKRLEGLRIGRVVSVVIVTVLSFCVIIAAGWLFVTQARAVAGNIPTYRDNIVTRVRAIEGSVHQVLGSASETLKEIRQELDRSKAQGAPADAENQDDSQNELPSARLRDDPDSAPSSDDEAVKVKVVDARSAELGVITAALTSLLGPLLTAGLAFVFVIFMLIWREDLRDRVIRVFGSGRVTFSTQAFNEMGAAVSRYLLLLFIVNAANGAIIALGLWLIGLPSALLWGLLMAVLRFLPLVGTLTAASMPILLSLAVSDSWTYPLMVVVLFLSVDGVSSNFVEPILYGSQVGASPMAVLVAATFWTWIWGPVGLLLAMPLTVSLVVLGRYVRPLSFLTILLGNQPALPRELRFYQRLLSNEAHEAKAIVLEALEQGQTREQVYEEVVAPAIALAKEEYGAGILDGVHAELFRDTVTAVFAEIGRKDEDMAPRLRPEFEQLRVDCVPARGRFDELLCQMACQLLSEDGLPCRVVSQRVLAGELVESLGTDRVDVLCILAVGRDGELGARYLVKRLLKSHPDLPIVIGAWTASEGGAVVPAQGSSAQVRTATSFEQLRSAVIQLAAKAAKASIRETEAVVANR